MERAKLRVVGNEAPALIFGTVPPRKQKNKERRPREWLTEAEVEAIAKAARKRSRYGARDSAMIMMCFRHGLRVSELVSLRWDQVNLEEGLLSVHRVKHGRDATHHIPGSELRELRQLRRDQPPGSPYVFVTERGGPMSENAFGRMLSRTTKGFAFPVHPHMLRHACGYKLVNDRQSIRSIQAYMGHKRIESTEIYTELSPTAFAGFFK